MRPIGARRAARALAAPDRPRTELRATIVRLPADDAAARPLPVLLGDLRVQRRAARRARRVLGAGERTRSSCCASSGSGRRSASTPGPCSSPRHVRASARSCSGSLAIVSTRDRRSRSALRLAGASVARRRSWGWRALVRVAVPADPRAGEPADRRPTSPGCACARWCLAGAGPALGRGRRRDHRPSAAPREPGSSTASRPSRRCCSSAASPRLNALLVLLSFEPPVREWVGRLGAQGRAALRGRRLAPAVVGTEG